MIRKIDTFFLFTNIYNAEYLLKTILLKAYNIEKYNIGH